MRAAGILLKQAASSTLPIYLWIQSFEDAHRCADVAFALSECNVPQPIPDLRCMDAVSLAAVWSQSKQQMSKGDALTLSHTFLSSFLLRISLQSNASRSTTLSSSASYKETAVEIASELCGLLLSRSELEQDVKICFSLMLLKLTHDLVSQGRVPQTDSFLCALQAVDKNLMCCPMWRPCILFKHKFLHESLHSATPANVLHQFLQRGSHTALSRLRAPKEACDVWNHILATASQGRVFPLVQSPEPLEQVKMMNEQLSMIGRGGKV